MTQANDANLVDVFTRSFGGSIAEFAPNVTGGTHQFEVIVEAVAGVVRDNNSSPYTITLTAFDITAGLSAATSVGAPMNPAPLAGPLKQIFSSTAASLPPDGGLGAGVSNLSAWPAYEQKFVITLTVAQAAAAAGHVFEYTAALQATGSDPIISIAQSPLFVLV